MEVDDKKLKKMKMDVLNLVTLAVSLIKFNDGRDEDGLISNSSVKLEWI